MKAREKVCAEAKKRAKDKKAAEKAKKAQGKIKCGRPKRGEERAPKELTRLERQKSMTLREMLEDLPSGCDSAKLSTLIILQFALYYNALKNIKIILLTFLPKR